MSLESVESGISMSPESRSRNVMREILRYIMDHIDFSHLVTVFVALSGWYVVHRLTAWRDRVNHRRQLKTQYLIDAYRRLANAANRPPNPNSPFFRNMETAIADIQLFGTNKDIDLVCTFLKDFSQNNQASLDPLLLVLRNQLRDELGYEKVFENVRWFRPDGSPEKA